jgi:queuine tRNA-ribosyltransferase
MKEVRQAIAEDRYTAFARDFRDKARAQESERTRSK